MLLLWLALLPAVGAGSLEMIALKNRPAAELVPVLKPLLQPGEEVTGTGYDLILKASPERSRELREIVARLDRELKNLRITVRRASREELEQEALAVRGKIHVTGTRVDTDLKGQVHSTRKRLEDTDYQTVRALEGTPAFIHSGVAFPVPVRSAAQVGGSVVITDTLSYRHASAGFYARVQLNGDQIRVDISPERSALSDRGGGAIETQGLVTTLRGRLGEWIELGGAGSSLQHQGSGIVHRTREKKHSRDRFWLRVDLDQGSDSLVLPTHP